MEATQKFFYKAVCLQHLCSFFQINGLAASPSQAKSPPKSSMSCLFTKLKKKCILLCWLDFHEGRKDRKRLPRQCWLLWRRRTSWSQTAQYSKLLLATSRRVAGSVGSVRTRTHTDHPRVMWMILRNILEDLPFN